MNFPYKIINQKKYLISIPIWIIVLVGYLFFRPRFSHQILIAKNIDLLIGMIFTILYFISMSFFGKNELNENQYLIIDNVDIRFVRNSLFSNQEIIIPITDIKKVYLLGNLKIETNKGTYFISSSWFNAEQMIKIEQEIKKLANLS